MKPIDATTVSLNLRVGERVRVKSFDEILSTLDPGGCLDSLPFMPEMVDYCGREFRIFKRFDKYSDYVYSTGLRRVKNAVLLDGVRCNGQPHGGCQALCQIIWKEAWLTRIDEDEVGRSLPLDANPTARPEHPVSKADQVLRVTRRAESDEGLRFSCQATEVYQASSPLPWWDVRQYWRDLSSGNVNPSKMLGEFAFSLFSLVLRLGGYRVLVGAYNRLQRIRGADPYPYRQGRLKETPAGQMNLKPGELVRVRSYDEILATLDTHNKNRGLWFDAEMVKYCGGIYPVLCRVERLIDNKDGRLIELRTDCIVLDGVTNRGDYHGFNPRNEYLFWREIWLERVAGGVVSDSQATALPSS